MFSSLLNAPSNQKIFHKIILFAIVDTPLGPPRELLRLLLTCQASCRALTNDSPQLHASIFAQKFDIQAPAARLSKTEYQDNAREELGRRFTALKCFRRGDLDDPSLTEALWIAYLMLEDSDSSQKNMKQLLWADLPAFIESYVRQRLYDGAEGDDGWPASSERNSLVLAVWWLISNRCTKFPLSQFVLQPYMIIFSPASVNCEPHSSRNEILRLLSPFVFAAFRYPIFNTGEQIFRDADQSHAPLTVATHRAYLPRAPNVTSVIYFGKVTRKANVPSGPLFATLLYFTRIETTLPAIPPHLLQAGREARVSTAAGACVGPTLEDVHHFMHACQTHFTDLTAIDFGVQDRQYDPDPSLPLGEHASYRLGSLTGRWQGSYIMPYLAEYDRWKKEARVPSEFQATGRLPMYLTLQEHYICDETKLVPPDELENGAANAWIPPTCLVDERADGIDLYDKNGAYKTSYHTFRPGDQMGRERQGVVDVIITGKTDDRHAAAWGGYKVLGRVRLSDGLIMLSRESLSGLGNTLLRGYVTSSQNFVGRFKGVSSGVAPAEWESTFSLCKDRGPSSLDAL